MRARYGSLVASVATWRLDVGKFREVEIDDRLKRLGSWAVAQTVWERGEPLGILGL